MELPGEIWVADPYGQGTEDLNQVVDVLITEFAGQLEDAVVIEHVVLASQQLYAAGVMAGLAPATESMARARLRAVSAGERRGLNTACVAL